MAKTKKPLPRIYVDEEKDRDILDFIADIQRPFWSRVVKDALRAYMAANGDTQKKTATLQPALNSADDVFEIG